MLSYVLQAQACIREWPYAYASVPVMVGGMCSSCAPNGIVVDDMPLTATYEPLRALRKLQASCPPRCHMRNLAYLAILVQLAY